jgi:DNA repair protein RadC
MNTTNTTTGNSTSNFKVEAHQTENVNYSKLSDKDLLAQLIGTEQAHCIYANGGSIGSVFSNKQTAPEPIRIARELLTRVLHEEMKESDSMNSPQAVKDFLTVHFAGQQYESFVAIYLDAQHRVIKAQELFRGTLTQTSVYPREIVKAALNNNAAAVIFAHNHPSGVAEPSSSDRMLTDALKQALALIDTRVLDHIIVAGNKTLSFAERGLI